MAFYPNYSVFIGLFYMFAELIVQTYLKLRLVLLTDQGKKKRLHVSHFADATLAEMIDEIAARCEASGKKYDGQRAAQILFSL